MKKQKICLIIDSLLSGGAQRQMVELALQIKANPIYDVFVVIYFDGRQLQSYLDAADIPVSLVEKKGKLSFSFLGRLVSTLKSEKPDLIVSYLHSPNAWARIAGRLAGVKNIITSVRNVDIKHSKARLMVERALVRFSTYVVVNAYKIQEDLISCIDMPIHKIKVIPNGIDTARFSRSSIEDIYDAREKYHIAHHEFVILLPGRISIQKNHMCLIKALGELQTKRIYKVVFVGNEFDQVLKAQIQSEAARLGLHDQVLFLGRQEDMPLFYSMANLVVLPSLWEGCPNGVLEAMSCQTPVVMSDVADANLIIDDAVNGYVFECNNPHDLCEKISKVMSKTDEELDQWGQRARSKILDKYSTESFSEAYFSLFNTLAVV